MVKLAANDQISRRFVKNDFDLGGGGCLPLPRGYIHVHDYYFQTYSPLKPLGQSKRNFMWSLFGKGKRKIIYINGNDHMTKIATMPICNINL